MNPLPLVDGVLYLDNSALELITTCPRQAQYYILHKREKSAERTALMFGGIIHKILEAKYKAITSPLETQTAIMLAVAADAFSTWTPDAEEFRNYDCAVRFVGEYQKLYGIEPFEVNAIETPFAVPIGEFVFGGKTIKVIWQGRIDLVVKGMESKLYGIDHKSTSMMGPSYFREFDLSSQIKGYGWAIRETLGITLEGFIVNALGIRRPTKSGKPFEFQRYTVRFSNADLEEWKQDTLHVIASFLGGVEAEYLPRHTKWCVGKYGECQYYNVCVLPAEHRATMLASGDYKPVTWNPLNPT
jgi:hypothetical protein